MALTDEDLTNIKAVVDARADLQDAKSERRSEELKLATRAEFARVRAEMATKQQLEEVKAMLTEDIDALGGDVRLLKGRIRTKVRS